MALLALSLSLCNDDDDGDSEIGDRHVSFATKPFKSSLSSLRSPLYPLSPSSKLLLLITASTHFVAMLGGAVHALKAVVFPTCDCATVMFKKMTCLDAVN